MNPKEIYMLVLSSLVIQGFKSTTISVDICANGYIILSLICNILVVVDLVAAVSVYLIENLGVTKQLLSSCFD